VLEFFVVRCKMSLSMIFLITDTYRRKVKVI